MRWRGERQSDNVEDRRGMSISRGAKVGGIGGLGLVAIVVISMFMGVDPSALLQVVGQNTQTPSVSQEQDINSPVQDDKRDFVKVILAQTEDVWNDIFQKSGKTYQEPKLVLFSGAVESACGMAGSATGPFYCPGDSKVYLDLTFFEELGSRFGASGDFAQGYVIAHEVGHHVQNQLGIIPKVHELQTRMSTSEKNKLNVMLELQADCLAGIWAHHTEKNRHVLEEGDIDEALNAASSVGDDRIQKQTQGYVVPDGFTHGSSAQRVSWFKRGWEEGNFNSCDTFSAGRL
ncbi:MAG TPA: neutral zinc metallopeptidase [Smithella sp.]|nr:neutral zinc metallopeptidase [Smithella sp.]MDM7987912.1 neutral zinc metallopeptidase [Smithella sp.]HNY50597.1 neutral zinc metallopeptidase [Smithella sp.]HOG89164.1 neutral zinc metallopeptidase [Smithella sp.]HOU51706.1 neutral zinc metallopeptidase [Smithella sp.]